MSEPDRTTLRPKARYGDPCNGCGLCCMINPCGAAEAILGQTSGRCAVLRFDGLGGWRCGLTTQAAPPYITEAAFIAIGAGVGCDMVDSVDDLDSRAAHHPEMLRNAREARKNASPAAEAVLRHWRLSPP